jgi:type IV conjugative transfer system protein TraE
VIVQAEQRQVHQLVVQRNVLVALLVLALLALIIDSAFDTTREERVVLMPSVVSGPMAIDRNRVSANYLERIGLDLGLLVLNRTPASTEYLQTVALQYAHPSAFGEIKAQLGDLAEDARRRSISTTFYPSGQAVDVEAMTVTLVGALHTYVGDQLTAKQQVTVKLSFTLETGILTWNGFAFTAV